jgi:hypothetical protein
MNVAAMNAYDAWANAAWAAAWGSFGISIAVTWLKVNKRNHAERMKELEIKQHEALTKELNSG